MKLNNNPKPHTVYAIVVSDIKTKINANISDVVEGFKDAGVSLANRSLGTGGDERVDILFGVDYVHLLPVHCFSFGRGNLSAVYYTCQGVMLAGDVNNLRANLPYLGAVSKFITNFDKYFRCLERNYKIINTVDCATDSKDAGLLDDELNKFLCLDYESNSDLSEKDKELIEYLIKNCNVNDSGRLVVPALWNSDVIDRLPNNYNLAYNILQSSTKKLNESQLFQYDEVIQQQTKNGIVEY